MRWRRSIVWANGSPATRSALAIEWRYIAGRIADDSQDYGFIVALSDVHFPTAAQELLIQRQALKGGQTFAAQTYTGALAYDDSYGDLHLPGRAEPGQRQLAAGPGDAALSPDRDHARAEPAKHRATTAGRPDRRGRRWGDQHWPGAGLPGGLRLPRRLGAHRDRRPAARGRPDRYAGAIRDPGHGGWPGAGRHRLRPPLVRRRRAGWRPAGLDLGLADRGDRRPALGGDDRPQQP